LNRLCLEPWMAIRWQNRSVTNPETYVLTPVKPLSVQFRPIVCAISSQSSPNPSSTVADWKRAFKKSAGTYGFWAGSERYTLRAISEANINFFACCFKTSLTILVWLQFLT
jgi:hypothetical protein